MMQRRPLTPTWVPGGILVIKESALVAMDVVDTLERQGFGPVSSVQTASDALDLLQRTAPGGVLVDPFWGGCFHAALIETLRTRAIPFAIITAHVYGNEMQAAARAAPIIAEPFTADDLGRAMAALLGQRR